MTRFAYPSRAIAPAALLLCLAASATLSAQTLYTIKTIAGKGTSGFSGDGAAALGAEFDTPYNLARDNNGNLYIADQANNRIRKIDASGVITTLAGDGTEFFLGDGGAATRASLINPLGVAVAPNGDIYIADSRNHSIRKVVSSGNIERVIGDGQPGFIGDMDTDSATEDPDAVNGRVNRPIGMVFDSAGNLYFTDSLNHRVRKINTSNKVSTVAGTGAAGYSGDGGAATSARLNYPQGIALDSGGNIYVADGENHVVRKISPEGIISTIAGKRIGGFGGDGGKATDALLYYPRGIAVDAAQNVYVADTLNSRIRRIAEDGSITTIAGNGAFGNFGEGGPAENAELMFPTGVTVGPNGTLYIVDTQNHQIKQLTPRTAAPTVAPRIDSGGIISASAFGAFSQAAPGSWVEIYGANFALRPFEWTAEDFVNGRAPTSIGGVQVTIGGQAAPIAYTGPSQVNVQVPAGLGAGPQQVRVTTAAGTATAVLTLTSTQPGLLAPSSLRMNSRSYAAAIFPDGTFVLPSGANLGFASRPARVGETLTLYGVGFGAVTPSVAAGQVPGIQTSLINPVKIYFGQVEAQVTYAGLAPGLVGVYQFNVIVPNVATGSAIPLTFTQNGQPGAQSSLFVAIGN